MYARIVKNGKLTAEDFDYLQPLSKNKKCLCGKLNERFVGVYTKKDVLDYCMRYAHQRYSFNLFEFEMEVDGRFTFKVM